MVTYSYLEVGLRGLSRAHLAGGMSGHLGSAVLAGYFFGELMPDLPVGVYLGIERDLKRIMAGEERIWFNAKQKGIAIPELFAPAVGESPQITNGVSRIEAALNRSSSVLRQSGHNVIFSSFMIRALHEHPEIATESIVSGLEKLMATFENVGEGKAYLGEELGWKQGAALKVPQKMAEQIQYQTLPEMVTSTIHFLVDHGHEHRRGMGGLIHLIDHAAALLELNYAGSVELAAAGVAVHRRHRAVLQSLPVLDNELGMLTPAAKSPLISEYWLQRNSAQWSAALTHRIKICYGYHLLRQEIESESLREQADAAFRYLVG